MGSVLEKNSSQVRKRIENHTFDDEGGDEYEASKFGGFGDYFRRKKIKLQNLDVELKEAAPDKPQIFKGTVVHVFGYTQPPLQVLHRELVQHGAGFLQYLDSKTMATHIVTSSLPPKKAVEYNKYRIVSPAWVTESIKAGKMLSWTDFRVVDEGPRQKTLKLGGGQVLSQAASQSPTTTYRTQTQNSYYKSQLKDLAEQIDGRMPIGSSKGSSSVSNVESEDGEKDVISTGLDGEAYITSANKFEPRDDPIDEAMDEVTEAPAAQPQGDEDPHDVGHHDVNHHDEDPHDKAGKAPDDRIKNMTPEEYNAWLLSDPKIRKASSANPDFLKQFYSESRLHHLSTWKAELKSRMQRLAAEKGGARPKASVRRKPGARRYVMHVDFDSFFCAVSLKSAPAEWQDKPACVAHGTGNGSELASCNYPARKFGLKNGMWMKKALELCPELKVLPYDFPAYEEASRLFYESILEMGGTVQSVSIDEALVDVTDLVLPAGGSDGFGVSEGSIWREQEAAEDIARKLRQQIKDKTGCTASVGIGANILQAKVALRKGKPDGQFFMKLDDAQDILGELKVEELPGVAWSTGGKLEEIGVKFVKDIRQVSRERLSSVLGPKTGEKLYDYARGIDKTEVGEQPPRKSVSAEISWGIRFISQEEADEFVLNLCRELERRLLHEQVKGRHLTLKIMRRSQDAPFDPVKHLGHGKCDSYSKSTLFGVATHDAATIAKEAVAMLRSFRFKPGDLRGLGVQLTKLDPIKASSADDRVEVSSQKRLSFGGFHATPSRSNLSKGSGFAVDQIEEIESPQKPLTTPSRSIRDEDPITDDPLTPRKPSSRAASTASVHPALALSRAGQRDSLATTPLNVAGTQFLLPADPDPAVVAALPPDIRSRLTAQGKARAKDEAQMDPPLPPGVDPDVFAALPDDVKAEVLASYGGAGGGGGAEQEQQQQHNPKKVVLTPSKKKVGGPVSTAAGGAMRTFLARSRGRERQQDAHAGLLQTSLLLPPPPARQQGGDGSDAAGASTSSRSRNGSPAKQDPAAAPQEVGEVDDDEEMPDDLDADFLAALPDEVRREVVADHQRRRLRAAAARKGGGVGLGVDLDRGGAPRRPRQQPAAAVEEQVVHFPSAETGGVRKVVSISGASSLRQVRDMLAAWHDGTSSADGAGGAAADGPDDEDVDVFARYLGRVVREERDMAKAVGLVRWIGFLVEGDMAGPRPAADARKEAAGGGGIAPALETPTAVERWRVAVGRMQSEVQRAVAERGLGRVDFG